MGRGSAEGAARERPILFSAPMVRAILAGRKTQTRRIVKPQPSAGVRASPFVVSGVEDGHGAALRCPYGQSGDRPWVRERWARKCDEQHRECVLYAATEEDLWRHVNNGSPRWRPSIHMPRWASRLTLEIESVRVERLQSISEEDAKAEGVDDGSAEWRGPFMESHREQFARLWDSINGERAPWASNPWVWAIGFRPAAAGTHAAGTREEG